MWLLDTNVISEVRKPKPETKVLAFIAGCPLPQLYISVVMLKWRLLLEDGRKAAHTYSQPDLIIAATARCHGFTIVTHDRSDYDKAGVPVIDPWAS